MEGLQGSGLRAKGLGLGVQGLRVQVDLVRGVGSCFLWVDDWVSFFVRLMGGAYTSTGRSSAKQPSSVVERRSERCHRCDNYLSHAASPLSSSQSCP